MVLLILPIAPCMCWREGWLWMCKLWTFKSLYIFSFALLFSLLSALTITSPLLLWVGLSSIKLVMPPCRRSWTFRLCCFYDSVLGNGSSWGFVCPVRLEVGKGSKTIGLNTISGSFKRLKTFISSTFPPRSHFFWTWFLGAGSCHPPLSGDRRFRELTSWQE